MAPSTSQQKDQTQPTPEVVPQEVGLQEELYTSSLEKLPAAGGLQVGSPDDPLEREADQIAEKISAAPEVPFLSKKPLPTISQIGSPTDLSFVRRKCAHCEAEEEEQTAQLKPDSTFVQCKSSSTGSAQISQASLSSSSGQRMPDATRSFMESRFGVGFQNVKIHTDSESAKVSQGLSAQAFTVGNDIYFNKGKFSPETHEGKNLLAHELTHVVQQASFAQTKIQRQLIRGEAFPDGLTPVITTSHTTVGMYQDAMGLLSNNPGHQVRHIFVITQSGITIYNLSQRSLGHFPSREGQPRFPTGLWLNMHGELGRYGFRVGEFTIEQRGTMPSGFSADRIEIIRGRGDRVYMEDFFQLTEAQLDAFSPALMISGSVSGSSGASSANEEPWAANQARDLNRELHQRSSSDTPSSERSTDDDRRTPDRVVFWAREDGAQFVNVWVNDQHTPVQLHEGESADELRDRVEEAADAMRTAQQQRAISQEATTTHGNVPFNESTYLGGADSGTANRQAFRADITGPEVMVRDGTGTFVMRLHYEDEFPDLLSQVGEAYIGSEYTWQIIDITSLQQRIVREREQEIIRRQQQLAAGETPTESTPTSSEIELDRTVRRDPTSMHDTVTASDVIARDAQRTVENFGEDVGNAAYDLTHPIASQDGSPEAAMRAVLVNTFNLATIPLDSIFSLGGWLVRSIAAVFRPHDRYEQEVPFPDHDGVFLVRCVAQPRPRGEGENQILRAPSVAIRVVTVKDTRTQTREELNAQDQNLQAMILELLLTYRLAGSDSERTTLRQRLELKVQEAAQSNRAFLDTQIRIREQERSTDVTQDVLQRITEEIEILQQGTHSSSGLISDIIQRQLVIKRAELEQIRAQGNPYRIRDAEREVQMLEERLETAMAREGEMGDRIIRPQAVFVNEEDGRTVPLLIELAQIGSRSSSGSYSIRVSDITGMDSDQHNASGRTLGDAVENALEEYANHFPYGRGFMMVRMPANNPYGITQPITKRCSPHDTAQASERLNELLQVLAVVGLAIPGVGVAAAAIGAVVSAGRLLSRVNNHTFRWDSNAVMDVLNIVGAVASGVSHLGNARLVRAQNMFALVEGEADMAQWVQRLQRFARIADFFDTAVNQTSYMLGTMDTVNRYLDIQRDEIRGRMTHAQARLARAQLITQSMFDHFMQHAPGVVGHFRGDGTAVPRTEAERQLRESEGTTREPDGLHDTEGTRPRDGEPSSTARTTERPPVAVAHVTVGELLGQHAQGVEHVPVIVTSQLTGNETRARIHDGRLVLEVGPHANFENVRQHLTTLRVLQRYEGVTGFIRQLLSRVGQLITGAPGFGSEGHEATIEVNKLAEIRADLETVRDLIENQMIAINDVATLEQLAAERRRYESDIQSVTEQLRRHEANLNSLAPGRGYVAMDDTVIRRNIDSIPDAQARQAVLSQLSALRGTEGRTIREHMSSADPMTFEAARFLLGRLSATGEQPNKARLVMQYFSMEFIARIVADVRNHQPDVPDHVIASLMADMVSGERRSQQAANEFMAMYDRLREPMLERLRQRAAAEPRPVTEQQTPDQRRAIPDWRRFEQEQVQAVRNTGVEVLSPGDRRLGPNDPTRFAVAGVTFERILAVLTNAGGQLGRSLLAGDAAGTLSKLSLQFVMENPVLRERLLDINDRMQGNITSELVEFFGMSSREELITMLEQARQNPDAFAQRPSTGPGGAERLPTTVAGRMPDIILMDLPRTGGGTLAIRDLTLRNDVVHQFKTAFYREVMRAILADPRINITATERISTGTSPDGTRTFTDVPIQ